MGLFGWLFRRSGEDRLAAEVMRRLRAAGVRDARYHRAEFAIEYRPRSDREPAWMYLSNLYAECQRDPANRIGRIDHFVAAFVSLPSMPDTWEAARPLLRPVLRGATFGRGGPSRHRTILRRPALPYLDELVVVDQPTSMGYVTDGMWGMPAQAIFAAARANLAAQPLALPPAEDDGPAVLRFFDSGDSYFVSRLLLDGWLAALEERVGGRPVAFVPDPGSLIVAADDPEVLGPIFATAAEEYEQAPRALSPVGYTVDDLGRLAPYQVGRGHPLTSAVARAERSLATAEYEAQRAVLHGEETDQGYFVAGCLLANRAEGTPFTLANWSRDQPTLLPVVDYVAFSRDDAEPFFVPWQVLLDEDLIEEAVEYRPTRFRAEAWPRPDTLARLAGRAVAL